MDGGGREIGSAGPHASSTSDGSDETELAIYHIGRGTVCNRLSWARRWPPL